MEGARRRADGAPGRGRDPLHGVGAERPGGPGHRGLLVLGLRRLPDALARVHRRVGAVPARGGHRHALQVRHHPPGRQPHPARRPDGPLGGGPPGERLGGHLLPVRVAGRGVDGRARCPSPAPGPLLGVRVAPGVLAAGALVPAARRAAPRVRQGAGLHARGADAGRRASVRRFVGLPGHRLLRADLADGHPGRLPLPGGRAAPGRDRGDRRLGARALPARRLGPRGVRRAAAVRAPRPAAGRSPGLGDAGVRLRAQGGPQLPRRQRRVLVRGVPRGRPARGRGGLDALPRLFARRGRVGAQRARRAGEPGRGRLPPGDERDRVPALPGGGDHRGGVHGVDGRDPADGRRRARLRPEVEHGLDARHPALHGEGAGAPQVPPPRHDLRDDLRLQRELRAADLARRGGARQGFAGVEDARGRLVATAGLAPGVPGLHVGPPGQATALHGAGVRAGVGVVGGVRPGLVAAGLLLRGGR